MAAYSRTPTISKDGLSTIVDDEPEDGFDDEGSLSLGSLDGVDQSLTQKSSSQSEEYRLNLARDETKQVFRLRLLVFLVLALAATTVCVLVYLVTLQSEEEEYQNQFEGAAAKLTDSFLDVAGSRLGVMASLGVSLTTSVNDNGQQEFPFITMSNFQQRAQPIRSQSGAVYMHFNPFIMEGQRVAWEQFLVGPEGSKWLDEGLAYQDEIGLFAYEEDLHGGGDVSDDPHAGHGSTGHEGQHEMDGTSMHAGGGDGEHSHHQQHAEEMEDTTSAATTVTEDSMNHTGASSGHDHQNMDQTVAPTTQHHHNDGSGMSMATASPQDDTHTGHHDNNMVSTTAPSQEETEETQPQHSMTQEPSSMGHHDHDMPPSSGMTSSGHATTTAPSAIGDGMHEDHTMMMTQEPTTMDYMATMNNGTTHHAMAMNATMSGSMSSPTSSSMNYPDETMQPNGTTDHGMAMNDTMNNTMSSSTSSMNHAGETMLHNGTTHHAMAMNATMQHNHRSLESMDAHAGHDTEDPHAGHQTNEPNAGQDNENSQADLHHDHDVYLALISEESWSIWYHNDKKELVYDEGPGPYMPTYLSSPIFYKGHETNENILQSYGPTGSYKAFSTESVVTSQFLNAPAGNKSSVDPKTALYARLLSANKQAVVAYEGDPFSQVFIPVFDSLEHNKTTVGVLVAWVHWMSFWSNLLPSSLQSIIVVMSDSCQNEYTYAITGTEVSPLGEGDLHDPRFDDMKRFASFEAIDSIQDGTKDGLPFNKDECSISIEVYPSHEFYDTYNTSAPVLFTCSILGIFLFTAIMFVLYDRLVERRQEIVMRKATQTDKIVASL
ncbi:Guanylate cyclase (Partial), partial [Seminavis robusta]